MYRVKKEVEKCIENYSNIVNAHEFENFLGKESFIFRIHHLSKVIYDF